MATKKFFHGMDLDGNKLTNIMNGTSPLDATNLSQLDALKDYTDAKFQGLGEFVDKLDPATGLPTTGSGANGIIVRNDWFHISADGTLLGKDVNKGDKLLALVDNPDTVDNTDTNSDFAVLHVEEGRFTIDSLSLVANTPMTVSHNLGYQIVQVALAGLDGSKIDVDVKYIDINTLTLEATSDVVVSGAISK